MKVNKKALTISLFVLLFFAGLILTSKVSAADFQILNHSIIIDVEEDGTATYSATLTIKNVDSENIISGYEYILPTPKPVKSSVRLNGREIVSPVYRIDEGPYSLIDISFGNDIITKDEQAEIKVEATLQNFVKSRKETKYLMLLSTNDRVDKFIINYPEDFGKPVLVTQKLEETAEETDSNTLELKSFNSALLIWGTEYTVDISSRLTIRGEQSNSIARIPLVPTLEGQSVEYRRIFSSIYGLYDTLGNVYSAVTLTKDSPLDVGYEARVTKRPTLVTIQNKIGYDFDWQHDFGIVEALDFTENEDEFVSLESLHNSLINEFPADFNTSEAYTNSRNYWEYLNDKAGFNSFDYCYILTAYAEHRGLQAEIRYGYPIIPDLQTDLIQPHVWCVFSDGENTILADPFYQVVNNLVYFGARYDFDRVTIGTWEPGLSDNSLLGLMSENESKVIKTVTIEEFGDFETRSPSVTVAIPDKDGIYSGFFFDINASVNNGTNNLLKINEIIFRGKQITSSIDKIYSYALLPNQVNEMRISGLRNPFFFSGGTIGEELALNFNDAETETILATFNVRYKIHIPLFAFTWTALSIFVIVSTLVIWKRLQKIRR